MTGSGVRLRDFLKTTAAIMIAGGLIVVAIRSHGKPNFKGLEGAYWTKRASYFKRPAQGVLKFRSNADVSTSDGWRGTVALDNGSERLEMNLVDGSGMPIGGLHVAALIERSGNTKDGGRRVLAMESDGQYRSNKLKLGKGRWDLTLTARNKDPGADLGLRFRIEKQITIN